MEQRRYVWVPSMSVKALLQLDAKLRNSGVHTYVQVVNEDTSVEDVNQLVATAKMNLGTEVLLFDDKTTTTRPIQTSLYLYITN